MMDHASMAKLNSIAGYSRVQMKSNIAHRGLLLAGRPASRRGASSPACAIQVARGVKRATKFHCSESFLFFMKTAWFPSVFQYC
jgi:hypothetical protein